MTKITAEHLGRSAFVYVRQSTADQLVHNRESPRRQYGLADRARQLGWTAVGTKCLRSESHDLDSQP
ncbi:hypothetical protein SAMN05519103_09683 [Rhizobiales bacterium GAS113]|nr:hypothetical protein SAMN05519103_09683 [Rhizobiales bacterium GAS113]